MNASIDEKCNTRENAVADNDRISTFKSAYSKLCNAIRACLNEEEKGAVNGMYLFLHLDFPQDRELHIDLVRNVPSGTDTGQHFDFEDRLTPEDLLFVLDVIGTR